MLSDLAVNSFKYDNEKQFFELLIEVPYIASVNSMYGINRRTGAVYLLPEPRRMKEWVHEQVTIVDPISHCPWLDYDSSYDATYRFILKSEYWSRDLDNCIKMVQDGIFECLHLNDSHICRLYGEKYLRSSSQNEHIIFKLQKNNFNYRALE